MTDTAYTHQELVLAVWEKTLSERERNPGLAHHNDVSLLRAIAMILTPSGVVRLMAIHPELKDQFAHTVATWRAKHHFTIRVEGAADDNHSSRTHV